MTNPLIRKLEQFTALSEADRRALDGAASLKVRRLGAREDIICEGERPGDVNLILSGWACRYKLLEDGRRQMVAFLVPGDICDARVFLLREMDHFIATLSPVTLADIPHDIVLDLTDDCPNVGRALWWSTLVDEAILREWAVNLGRRTARERIAHLLCELFHRLRAVGLTEGNSCELPPTQAELADALGLSVVHVNRTLQELRRDELVELRGKTLTMLDPAGLRAAAMFNTNYLHQDRGNNRGGAHGTQDPAGDRPGLRGAGW